MAEEFRVGRTFYVASRIAVPTRGRGANVPVVAGEAARRFGDTEDAVHGVASPCLLRKGPTRAPC